MTSSLQLFLFISSLFISISTKTTFYVNQNTLNSSPDGTKSHPFHSLDDAVANLPSDEFEILLLGTSVNVSTEIVFPSDCVGIVRPEIVPDKGYFQLNFEAGASINVYSANVTFESLKIYDFDKNRDPTTNAFAVTGGYLCLNRTFVSGIDYNGSTYMLVFAGEDNPDTELAIVDSVFENLVNVGIMLWNAKMEIHGNLFTGIQVNSGSFFLVYGNMGPLASANITNTSVINSTFGYANAEKTFTGFIDFSECTIDVNFQGFYARDVTMTNSVPMIVLTSSTAIDDFPTTISIVDTTIENIYEALDPLSSTQNTGLGLVFDITGTTNLIVQNFTANNVKLQYDSMLRYSPDTSTYDSGQLNRLAVFQEISIENSSNANFVILSLDEAIVGNVSLQNNYINDTNLLFPYFMFQTLNRLSISDFYAQNISGPIIRATQALIQTLDNLTFIDISVSQDLAIKNQDIVFLSRESSALDDGGLDYSTDMVTTISNFNVDGFWATNGRNNSIESNNTYMLVVLAELGSVEIRDSRWNNIEMGFFLSTSMNVFQARNITVEADPSIPSLDLPWNRIFQFVNVNELVLSDITFLNNQNVVLFTLFNIDRSVLYNSVKQPQLTFRNIVTLNNSANYSSLDTIYMSLFVINSPLKSIEVVFENCTFRDNKVCKGDISGLCLMILIIASGLISALESYQINFTLEGNVFENNYAIVGGAAFSAQTMQDCLNTLTMKNNVFKNNWSSNNGGVFAFSNSWYTVYGVNNTYTNNSALSNGGVGYVFSAKLSYWEYQSLYESNYAGKLGGSWYFSTSYQWGSTQPIQFIDTTFSRSSAAQSGGALYVALSSLIIEDCRFYRSRAGTSGGDIYLLTFSTMNISNTTFKESFAPQGSFLYADSLDGKGVIIQDSEVSNIAFNQTMQNVVQVFSGILKVLNSTFTNISAPLFRADATITEITNTTMHNITCNNSETFCIVQGATMTLNITSSTIKKVNSNKNLIVLTSPGGINLLQNLTLSNLNTIVSSSSQSSLFAISVSSANNFTIFDSVFQNLRNFSGVQISKSNLLVNNSNFSNSQQQQQKAASRTLSLSGIDDDEIEMVSELDDASSTLSSVTCQFLVLTSTNTTLTNSSFLYNGQPSLVNGGAIRILGNSGDYSISGSDFEGNQGYQGGAISVEGQVKSFAVDNTQFTGNIAVKGGGAVYFANSSVKAIPTISSSIFQENEGLRGGAIFVGNQQVYIGSSGFSSNIARDGGAIASWSEAYQIIILQKCIFYENIAKVGSALRPLGAMNFNVLSCTFSNNEAEIGGYLATNPTQIHLTVYQVPEYFLFVDDVTAEYILEHAETEVIYDSNYASEYNPLIQKTGKTPSFVFVFTFLDNLGENLPIIEQATVSIDIKNFIVPRGGITPGLLGSKVYNFNTTTGYIFDSLSVRGTNNSTVTLSAKGIFNNTFANQMESLPTLEWKVTLGNCTIGEIYDAENLLCIPCGSGTYSLEDPYTAKTCHDCPDNMNCLGGRIYFPNSGFWRISATSDNIVRCYNNEACLGGRKDSGKNVSLTGFCAEGYEGVACASCSRGYAKFGTSQKCMNCSTNAGYYIKFVAFFLIQAAIIAITTMVFLRSISEVNKDNTKSNIVKTSLVKILIDYVQVTSLILDFNFNWPNEIGAFLEAVTKVTPTNKDALSIDCFIALISTSQDNIFFIKLLFMVVQPIFYIIAGAIVWIIVFRRRGERVFNNPEMKKKIFVTTLVIVYILQPGIAKATLQLFNCQDFGPTGDNQYYLVEDTNIKCWEPRHVSWTLALGIPALIIWVIIPSVLLIYLVIRRKFTRSKQFVQHYSFIFERYHEKAFYWEVLILARKILIIVFAVFITFAYLQAYLSFIMILVMYGLQFKVDPFVRTQLNNAEKLSLFSAGFLLYTSLFFIRHERTESLVPFLLSLDTFFGTIFLIYCIYLCKEFVKHQLNIFRLKLENYVYSEDSRKSAFLRRIIKKLLASKLFTRETLITRRKERTDTETNLKTAGSEIPLDSAKGPFFARQPSSLAEILDKDVRAGRVRLYRSSSADFQEESASNMDPQIRLFRGLKGSCDDENILRIPSLRGTEIDLLNSYRGRSMGRRRSTKISERTLPSQILDLAEDRTIGVGSLQDLGVGGGSRKDVGLHVVVEETPTNALKKSMLRDDRFKDLDRVKIQFDEDEEGAADKTYSLGPDHLENDEVIPLSALKDQAFIDSLEEVVGEAVEKGDELNRTNKRDEYNKDLSPSEVQNSGVNKALSLSEVYGRESDEEDSEAGDREGEKKEEMEEKELSQMIFSLSSLIDREKSLDELSSS